MKRILALVAAAGMAVAPVAASAQDASALSLAGASVPTVSGVSFFSEEGGGGSTAVILGVVLVILIGVAAISGNDSGPSSP